MTSNKHSMPEKQQQRAPKARAAPLPPKPEPGAANLRPAEKEKPDRDVLTSAISIYASYYDRLLCNITPFSKFFQCQCRRSKLLF